MSESDQEFIATIEELLEEDPGSLDLTTPLADLPWDSLAFVAFLAMADEKYGARVAPTELRACQCVADLLKLVEKK